MNILDSNDVPISQISLQQAESSDSQVIIIRVPCAAGKFLTADILAEVQVLVRETGTVDAFVDIGVSPLDLAPYDGTNQDFDMKVHTGAVAGMVSVAAGVRVTHNP